MTKELKPKKALNKAFLKVKPSRSDIERFKTNLIALLERINDSESEEFHKNLVIDFLKKTYYDPNHFVNTKGRNDLVIHNGKNAKSSVGVIIEAKKPTNRTEMLSKDNMNKKAFHELVLYYLRERITHKNDEVKYLIATNINEWFIFDVTVFDRLFAQNKFFVNKFNDFEGGRLADTKTDFFYKYVAEPFISEIHTEIEFTYFNLQDYQKPLQNKDQSDDNKLIALFKLLSPEHLLKLPFQNDSNSLDKRFYSELLHIIGLTEVKEKNKKLIQRNKPGERNTGTILEDSIIQLDSLDRLSRLEKPGQFGSTTEEKLFNVALELSITWINRILFLKLLEAQLMTYHKGDKSYSFLNIKKIRNYDDLNSLFFQVLARKHSDRNEDVKKEFEKVPYLNSSLFEPNDLEHATLFISNLKDDKTIPIFSQTVLKDQNGKKKKGEITTLEYLFEFLNAYDFSSEGSEEIQEENKSLINASVLGLIFEKINGYKDGSFFTPGFITMYMCKETIRKAVVQKFKENCLNHDLQDCRINTINDIYELIPQKISRKQANEIINSIKICDPAVGSGHFLVSALNEIIAVKNDLKILEDKEGKSLHRYEVEVVNDELIVTDEEGELFEYNPNNKESQRIQETLFHEKQTIIENSLFGVDINTNSVKICRLRLWIELLKNAYYKNATELETLPNIDINIKCGNSLVSRYSIDADIKNTLKKSKYCVDSYRTAVMTYRNADNKEQKRAMEKLINEIKNDFESKILINDKRVVKINKLKNEMLGLTGQERLFGMTKTEKATWNKKVQTIGAEIENLENEIEEIRNNKIYENAFEWRFEFPEILNNNGEFSGFDVVIGNPPYIRQEEISKMKMHLKSTYQVFDSIADIYVYFLERGASILRKNGTLIYILPNKWMRAKYGNALRSWAKQFNIEFIVDFRDLPVFEEATTYPCIWSFNKKAPSSNHFAVSIIDTRDYSESLEKYVSEKTVSVDIKLLNDKGWNLVDDKIQKLMQKIKSKGKPLGEYVDGNIYRGVLTGLNEAFVIDTALKEKLITEDPKSAEVIKPYLLGKNIKKYQTPESDKWLILFPKGFTIKKSGNAFSIQEPPPRYGDMSYNDAWQWFKNNYPAIAKHLIKFKEKAEKRTDKGDFWWELRACDYYSEFEKAKIMLPDIALKCEALIDDSGFYCANTAYVIPGLDEYHLGILNSKLVHFFYSNLTQTIRGGYFRFIRQYLEQIPVAEADKNKEREMKEIVENILSTKRKNSESDTTDLEKEIDQLVYQLYDLTPEEIKIVEK
jgi:adenine-specific DNA-methyltransferase